MGTLAGTGAGCVFCAIVEGREAATIVERTERTIIFHPLNPVTPGHVLVAPTTHVEHFAEDIEVTAETFRAAAALVAVLLWPDANLITSMGGHATQTIGHLHVHVVPRREGDGLTLPWSPAR